MNYFNDERYWDINLLNKWFAISSILFLISIIWMFVDANDDDYKNAAIKNLDFILSNQLKNGWFKNCDNTEYRNHEPLTHLIVYTVQGLIESSRIINDDKYYFCKVN